MVARGGLDRRAEQGDRVGEHDPTAHAEILALRAAAAATGSWRLDGCTLAVTLEPCAMCAGAIVLARVERLVIGAMDPKAGFVGSLGDLARDPRLNHRVDVATGVLEVACGDVLRAFFRERRA
ncbi:MAG: nucleoside deaminase [Actinomycetota bacterium]